MKEKNMKTVTKELENRNPNNKNSLAYRLNYIIKNRRYTAKEVAALTEDKDKGLKPISPATLSLYINGKTVPTHFYTQRLAQVLNVDPGGLSCDLPFEFIKKKTQPTDIKELVEMYTRLNLKWQRYVLATAKMALLVMQHDDNA